MRYINPIIIIIIIIIHVVVPWGWRIIKLMNYSQSSVFFIEYQTNIS